MSKETAIIGLAVLGTFFAHPAGADPTTEDAMLLPSDGEAGDSFGAAVALSADGSRALIGASLDDTAASNAGSARVFRRSGSSWVEEATLVSSDGAAGDWLGIAVSLDADGSRALVGASLDDTVAGADAGSARVFVRSGTTWTEEATLVASDEAELDHFGGAVALSADGDRALVGAWYDDTAAGVDAGSARVFVRSGTTWTEEATLLATEAASGDQLGISVALARDGTRAVLGTYVAGNAVVFVRDGSTWTQEESLGYPLRSEAVALSGDGTVALIGASGDGSVAPNAGGAPVYVRTTTTWTGEATLRASDGAVEDFFGGAVALGADGGRAIVGASGDDSPAGTESGSARVFQRTGMAWIEEGTLLASQGAASDYFGSAVAVSDDGRTALVGAIFADAAGGVDSGGAWVFTLPVCGDGVTEVWEACDDGGDTPSCDVDCTAVECGDGTVNAAAGEMCEPGDDPDCNADCTLVDDGDEGEGEGEGCCDSGGGGGTGILVSVLFAVLITRRRAVRDAVPPRRGAGSCSEPESNRQG